MEKPIERDTYPEVTMECRGKEIAKEILDYGEQNHNDERREFMLAALFASLALAVTTDLAKDDYLVIAAAYFDNMRTHKKRISL